MDRVPRKTVITGVQANIDAGTKMFLMKAAR